MSTKKIYVTTYTPTPIDHFLKKLSRLRFLYAKILCENFFGRTIFKKFLRASQDIAEKTFYSK